MANNTNSVNGGAMPRFDGTSVATRDRRQFIGGSDARIIMGKDEKALQRLWQEKRGEVAPLDLSGVLIVQLGLVTEDLNRRWYEQNSGHRISDVQRHVLHRSIPWMAATLDGLVKETGAVFEAKFMLPWSFSEEAAAEKHMAQLQHNMLVAGTKKSVLSIINGGGKWVELSIEADPIYQTILIAAEKAFWRAARTGEEAAGLVRLRAPEATHRGGPGGRHERFKFLGGVCHPVLWDPPGPRRPRTGQERAERPDAGGRQGGHGPRHPRETLKIRSAVSFDIVKPRWRRPTCIDQLKAQRPSPTALAKAQTEITNPEKAMVRSVYNNRSGDTPKLPLRLAISSGLDIVRKALGSRRSHIAQTTDIDRASATVNLTTILLHTSGE